MSQLYIILTIFLFKRNQHIFDYILEHTGWMLGISKTGITDLGNLANVLSYLNIIFFVFCIIQKKRLKRVLQWSKVSKLSFKPKRSKSFTYWQLWKATISFIICTTFSYVFVWPGRFSDSIPSEYLMKVNTDSHLRLICTILQTDFFKKKTSLLSFAIHTQHPCLYTLNL